MKLSELIKKRREELGLKWTDFEDAGIHCNTLSNLLNDKQGSIKPATQERLALVLKLSQGEIQACMAEMNPLKKVIVNKKSLAKQKSKKAEPKPEPEPEPEELPFDDLPEEEPEEGEDMKWFEDIPKNEEAPEKVKVKIQPEKKEEDGPYILPNEIVKLMPMPKEEDNINHPAHYTQGGIECIEAIKASMTASEFRGYLKGNAMKYMWRYQLKNGVEDLRKAQWYLNRLIGEMAK